MTATRCHDAVGGNTSSYSRSSLCGSPLGQRRFWSVHFVAFLNLSCQTLESCYKVGHKHFPMQLFFFSCGAAGRRGPWSHSRGFLDHTQRSNTVGRTPLDEWSARRRDLCLTIHNTHSRKTSMTPVGLEPTVSEGELPQTYALDHAATRIGRMQPLQFSIL